MAANPKGPDHDLPADDDDRMSIASTASSLAASIFGQVDAVRENAFRHQREQFNAELRSFAGQYDQIRDNVRTELAFEENQLANEVDGRRTEIIGAIVDWMNVVHRDFSPNIPAERPIFRRLLSWAKLAQNITNSRPYLLPAGHQCVKRSTWPLDDEIYPPKRTIEGPMKRNREIQSDDYAVQQDTRRTPTAATKTRAIPTPTSARRLPENPQEKAAREDAAVYEAIKAPCALDLADLVGFNPDTLRTLQREAELDSKRTAYEALLRDKEEQDRVILLTKKNAEDLERQNQQREREAEKSKREKEAGKKQGAEDKKRSQQREKETAENKKRNRELDEKIRTLTAEKATANMELREFKRRLQESEDAREAQDSVKL